MSGVVPSVQCYGVQKQWGDNLLNLHIFEVLENPVFSKSENYKWYHWGGAKKICEVQGYLLMMFVDPARLYPIHYTITYCHEFSTTAHLPHWIQFWASQVNWGSIAVKKSIVWHTVKNPISIFIFECCAANSNFLFSYANFDILYPKMIQSIICRLY